MKPETARFFSQAEACAARAEKMLEASLEEDAARTAYLVAFHGAQAMIFERTDRSPKTHNGVRTEFLRLTKDDLRVDLDLRRFLSEAYAFKRAADYFDADELPVSADQAVGALATAKHFLAHVRMLVASPPAP